MPVVGVSKRTLLLLLLIPALCASARAQTAATPQASSDEKSEEIIKKAIDALGGETYLNVRTVVGRGFYTAFQEGASQLPTRFLDYIAYPDRERTEFTGSGVKVIQTNSGDTGWLFDGGTKKISDMKPAQIEDFKRSMRTSVENLLKGWWRKQGASIKYVGRREAGLARRNDAVRLTYPDGFWIEYEFGTKDSLPAKILYQRTRTKMDSDETEDLNEEDRLAKHITEAGVTAPWVIDHFVNGFQTSRINYESIEYNRALPDSLFAKPENVKDLK
jgi:hypothetical protein